MASKTTSTISFILLTWYLAADVHGQEATCDQFETCGIPCPEAVPPPHKGFGAAVICFAIISCIIGIATVCFVSEKTENFFVAGRNLPLWIVIFTLASASLDSNALLGNADLSYKFQFWDGAVLPIGLGLSLILNGLFLARHIQKENALTLPEIYAKRYGRFVEVLISLVTMASFLFLLAGNLVGMGSIFSYLFNMNPIAGIWISMIIITIYTACGGLYSIAFADIFQSTVGWIGAFTVSIWCLTTEQIKAAPPSVGFPGYIYPDGIGEGGICDMYQGVPCTYNADLCCYNEENQTMADNGAYPFGDLPVFPNQMTSPYSLSPFPNAILFNWATIFVLGFGNLAALDFQARCMAARTPSIATIGCVVSGFLTILIGIPFAYLGAIVRYYYGPDSVHAEFTADTCSTILGLPTCAMWNTDQYAFLKYLTNNIPPVLGAWCVIAIFSASMSTASGAILAPGTVISNNLFRHFESIFGTEKRLLLTARVCSIAFAIGAAAIASKFSGQTGYLLIVAFDICLASAVVPLFGCFYAKNPRPVAAAMSIICGAITRIVLEFTLPKDGYLLLPFPGDEFLDYGPTASNKLPPFIDAPAEEVWDPSTETCSQKRFSDFTGVDSLGAMIVSLVVFLSFQYLERDHEREESWLCKSFWFKPYNKRIVAEDDAEKEVGRFTNAGLNVTHAASERD